MAEQREPTPHPPSDPRYPGPGPLASRGARDDFVGAARPARAVMVLAVLLGLLLVASGLYLWRRPREPQPSAAAAAASSAAEGPVPPSAPVEPPPPSPVTLSDPRVLGCHDRGPGTTPPDECDHVEPVEKALARVIEQSAACVPEPDAGAGATIEYVADVSFSRRRVRITLPRAGRSVHDRKIVRACAAAVRDGMKSAPLDGVDHRHARYTISVTATYRGTSRGQNAPGSGPN